MILLPALRLATGPFPPGFFAARFLAAVIRPPLLFFAISITSFWSGSGSVLADVISPMGEVESTSHDFQD
jgi:hypothetical protein